MWFRNLQLYRLTQPFELDDQALHQALDGLRFKPCGGLDAHSLGWTEPLGDQGQQLVHAANGRFMICLRREDRLLPPAVIREVLEDKVRQIEAEEGRPVGRRERTRLRDEIVVDLLPRAFTRSQLLYAYIDPRKGWILVDSATPNRAEELLSSLREALGSLKATPLSVSSDPALSMTRWVEQKLPEGFEAGDECELKEPGEGGAIIRARKLPLDSDEIRTPLDAGMLVTRLALTWRERLSCLVCDDLSIKRLRFLDLVMEEAADVDSDDQAARFDADFTLMAAELEGFVAELIEVFGGLDEQPGSVG